jgi:hypothetical protein
MRREDSLTHVAEYLCERNMAKILVWFANCMQPKEYGGFSLEVVGDKLTPLQMCEAFSQAQGGLKVNHFTPPKFLFWFINRQEEPHFFTYFLTCDLSTPVR